MGLFCLIEVGILSPSPGLLCTTWVQLRWLRPLVAPVSSSAPGRGDCPALIPALIIFKAAGIYITLMQAPVALQLPQEAAFLAFLSCLVGSDCYHGPERHSGTTEASGPYGWIWMISRFGLPKSMHKRPQRSFVCNFQPGPSPANCSPVSEKLICLFCTVWAELKTHLTHHFIYLFIQTV